MKIHTEFQQGSLEWLTARAGIPTASEFDNLVTPEFKIRTGDMVKSYLDEKLDEAWIQGPRAGFSTFSTEQGQILEEEAVPWYRLEYVTTVRRVGLCTSDDGRIACSPDGLLGDDGGIEIKCPSGPIHVGYLLGSDLPKKYRAQVYGSMLVTGRPWWNFMSYHRDYPKLVVRVERDEAVEKRLKEALATFLAEFDARWAKLCEKNGGPPRKRKVFVPSPESEDNPYYAPGIIP